MEAVVDRIFKDIKVYPHVGNFAQSPTGESYITFVCGAEKAEGAKGLTAKTREYAFDFFEKGLKEYVSSRPSDSILYWRQKPQLETEYGKIKISCRLLLSNKPVIQSHDKNEVV